MGISTAATPQRLLPELASGGESFYGGEVGTDRTDRAEPPGLAKRYAAPLLPVLLVALAALVLDWWRGPQPERSEPSAALEETAGQLLRAAAGFLRGDEHGVELAMGRGRWFVTAYPTDGRVPITVPVEGALAQWAPALRDAWPGRLQVDHAIEPAPAPRAGPRGLGLDVGLDGWIGEGGEVFLPVHFVLEGFDRARLAAFFQDHPGQPLRTYAWVLAEGRARRMVRHGIDPGPLTAELLRRRIDLGADYLARHLRPDDQYDYEWDARQGRLRGGYNLLRHAGTTYSLFQVYRQTGRTRHYRAAVRALRYLRRNLRFDSADPGRCFELEGDKVKLGGAGLTLLALVEQAEAHPDEADWGWMRCLAAHIVAQTDGSGDMASFYTDGTRYRWSDHRSMYYPGEALLGLVRLYAIDPQPRWLECAQRAADFLVHRRWVALGIRVHVPLDAWLIQALERLVRITPEPAYGQYALAIGEQIARAQLVGGGLAEDLVGGPVSLSWPDVVSAGSRGEALAAAARLERTHRPGERFFLERLEASCRYALRNQYTSPILFGLQQPQAALGGMRSSPVEPIIRIDGVQHNLSALVGLLELREGER